MITSLTIMSENSVLNRLRLGDEQLANQENSTTSSSLNNNNSSNSSSRSNHTAMSSPIQVHTYPSHQQQTQHNGQQYHPESDYFLINSYLYHSSMSPPMIPDHSSSFSCSLNSNASRNVSFFAHFWLDCLVGLLIFFLIFLAETAAADCKQRRAG